MKCYRKQKEEHKSGSGATKKRKYMFYDELLFLSKVATPRQTTSNVPADRRPEREDDQTKYAEPKEKPTRKKKNTNEMDMKMMSVIDASIQQGQSRIMNFFKGIAPTVDKFNDEDIVEFQFEVMKLTKNISSKYKKTVRPQSYDVSWNTMNTSRVYQHVGGPSSYQTAWTNERRGHPQYHSAELPQPSTSATTPDASSEHMCFESYASPSSTLSNISDSLDFSNEF